MTPDKKTNHDPRFDTGKKEKTTNNEPEDQSGNTENRHRAGTEHQRGQSSSHDKDPGCDTPPDTEPENGAACDFK